MSSDDLGDFTIFDSNQYLIAIIVLVLIGLLILSTLCFLIYVCRANHQRKKSRERLDENEPEGAGGSRRSSSMPVSDVGDAKPPRSDCQSDINNNSITKFARTEYQPSSTKMERDNLKRLPKDDHHERAGGPKSDHIYEQAMKIEIMKYKKLMAEKRAAEAKKEGASNKERVKSVTKLGGVSKETLKSVTKIGGGTLKEKLNPTKRGAVSKEKLKSDAGSRYAGAM